MKIRFIIEPDGGAICVRDGAVSLTAYPGPAVFLVMYVCSTKQRGDFSRGRQARISFWKVHVKMINLWVKLDMVFSSGLLYAMS